MAWAPGEQQRERDWYISRSKRMQQRVRLELAMAGSPSAYAKVYDNIEPLIDFFRQLEQPEEEEFPDSRVIVNQNVW